MKELIYILVILWAIQNHRRKIIFVPNVPYINKYSLC